VDLCVKHGVASPNGRVTSSKDARGQTTTTAYTPASGGPVRQTTTTNPLGHGTTISNQCFNYDPLRQLTEAWTTTDPTCQTTPTQPIVGGPDPYWTSYRYNTIGNRTQETQHAPGGDTTRDYTYPTSGPGVVRPHAVTSITATGAAPGTDSYSYDQTGNTTTRNLAGKPGQTLTWDPEGHLATITDTTGTTSYLYTPDGTRLLAYEPGAVTTLYLGTYELRRTTTGVSCTRHYGVAARTTSSGLTWLAADHHSTGQLTIHPTTLAVTRRKTDPFGNPRGSTPTWPTTRGFIDGTQDPTGLTHLGAREYEPNTGRFISVDPLLDLADPIQMNGYTYANSNPTTASDPTGLVTCIRLDDRSGPCAGTPAAERYEGDRGPKNTRPQRDECMRRGSCSPSTPTPSWNETHTFSNGVTVIVNDYGAFIYIPGTAPYRLPPGADPRAVGAAVNRMVGAGFKNPSGRHHHLPAPYIIGHACEEYADPGTCSRGFREALSADYLAAIASGDPAAPVGSTAPATGPYGQDPVGLLGMVIAGGVGGAGKAASGRTSGQNGRVRPVGQVLESVDDVMANPSLLQGMTPGQVGAVIGRTPGWRIEALGKGSHRGQGWILREYDARGVPTGRMIQWHPGGGHHGPSPYWKVSSPKGGTVRIQS
jgi:RHS repeat-associated protein